MKVLVTGASGFLGTKVMKLLRKNFSLVGVCKERKVPGLHSLNIANKKNVVALLQKEKPDVVLHIAAMTDVDKCEVEKEEAWQVNVAGTKNVLEGCKAVEAKMVYISTDFVFDGKKGDYKETDKPNPMNYYGKTKLEAEKLVQASGVSWLIGRVQVLYGYNEGRTERSFVAWLYQSLKEGKETFVVDDQICTPTLIDDAAVALKILIQKKREGVYHISTADKIIRYAMALQLAKAFGFDTGLIHPISSGELAKKIGQKAQRPMDTSYNTEKLKREGILMHGFREGVRIMQKQIEGKE